MLQPRTILAGIALVGAVAIAGCGSPAPSLAQRQGEPGIPPPRATTPLPSALIGQWRVSGSGIKPGTLVNVSPGSMSIFLKCGGLAVSWDVRPGGNLIAEVNGGYGNCFDGHNSPTETEPAWVASAYAFTVDGPRRRILDRSLALVATLSPTRQRPIVPPGTVPSVTDPPRVSRKTRAAMDAQPPPLPAGVRRASQFDLVGGMGMLPDRQGYDAAWIIFRRDGTYHLSHGCNGAVGRWTVLDGPLLYTMSGMTLIGCDNINLLDNTVRSVGMLRDQLVLIDQHGRELHRLVLVREPQPRTPSASAPT